MRSTGRPFIDKSWLRAFLKDPVLKKAGELFNLSRNQVQIVTELLTRHCHLKGHLFKLGLVNSPKCDRCKEASEMALHVLCGCEALDTCKI
jgi:hypothetical protein